MDSTHDTITLWRATEGKLATKSFHLDGAGTVIKGKHKSGWLGSVAEVAVSNIRDLAAVIERVATDPRTLVLRGALKKDINLRAKLFNRRKHDKTLNDGTVIRAAFEERPRWWMMIDCDEIQPPVGIDPAVDPDAAIEFLVGRLPDELREATCFWQWSSSQNLDPEKAGTLNAHLFFWLDRPLGEAELKRWAKAVNTNTPDLIDPCTLQTVQEHFIADPVLEGLVAPLPRRCGLRVGLVEAAALPVPPEPVKPVYESGKGHSGGVGVGVDGYLAEIGGAGGFRIPLRSAIGSYFAVNGADADPDVIKASIRDRLEEVDPGGVLRPEYRTDAHLDGIISWTVAQRRAEEAESGPRASE